MRNTWEYFSTKNIIFGNGAIQKIDGILRRFNAKNVFIITDQGIVQTGILEKVLQYLKLHRYQCVVYDQATPEPPISSVMEAYDFAQGENNTDVIIGLGGGSSIDLAKVVALLMEHGGHPRNYFEEGNVPGPIAPLIAIPTTAGTGSEVTSVAVVNDTDNDLKVGISDNYLRPAVALLDPKLTIGLPPYVTACSGIDALSHAIESYTALEYKHIKASEDILFQGSFPITDALALKAIELIYENLVLAVHQGSNLEARASMLAGSVLAGMAFSNAGNALGHALAYPIGGKVKSPHGEITGLLLPYVMRYNLSTSKNKMTKIAQVFELNGGKHAAKDVELSPADAVQQLVKDIGLPTKLSTIGIKEEELQEISNKTLHIERLIRNNPRNPREEDLVALLKRAY
ncbi:iron-containing alcohol dehydrogenase [Salicibibacter cibi]|uniref:hydroxyacid-oxoacid transhydrogenase n=1 Tax=Salicibibacter cibi TaxID=2743001 RepID=A0A7T6Z9H3_9BACI|nr:hydroxyacid-oxoacid transhydrogenase [Salicibibacter cibi]QQK78881.1 iron-containing alcohol dehydrogenase [Salicibibacter cibi]